MEASETSAGVLYRKRGISDSEHVIFESEPHQVSGFSQAEFLQDILLVRPYGVLTHKELFRDFVP
jgi:hypothetical protein